MCEAADGGLGSFPVFCHVVISVLVCTSWNGCDNITSGSTTVFIGFQCLGSEHKNLYILIYRDLKCSLCMSILILLADACPSRHGTEIHLQHSAMRKNPILPKLPC